MKQGLVFKQISQLLLLLVLSYHLLGCSSQSSDPGLEKAAQVIQYMMRPKNLSRSIFSAAFADPKASNFVSYIFSPMGAAEWPIPMDDFEKEQMQSIGAPIAPADISYNPLELATEKSRQIVVKFDDDKNLVIAEAYDNPNNPPIFVKEWELSKVKPAAGIKEMFESNRGMGMSYQLF